MATLDKQTYSDCIHRLGDIRPLSKFIGYPYIIIFSHYLLASMWAFLKASESLNSLKESKLSENFRIRQPQRGGSNEWVLRRF